MNEKTTQRPPRPRSFLALEEAEFGAERPIRIPEPREFTREGCRVSHGVLQTGASYHTLVTGQLWLQGRDVRRRHTRVLRSILLAYLEKAGICVRSGRVLFCGLGNERITADALGPMVCDRLRAVGRDPVYAAAGMGELYVMKTGVPSQTGMETGKRIRWTAQRLGADLIMTADAACARTLKRLSAVVQVTDGGVTAGSGTGNGGDAVTGETMPCPVISIGVPTVIAASALGIGEEGSESLLVASSEIDLAAECYASLIADAVNGIFTPMLEWE